MLSQCYENRHKMVHELGLLISLKSIAGQVIIRLTEAH